MNMVHSIELRSANKSIGYFCNIGIPWYWDPYKIPTVQNPEW
ncbi:7346_t:CDS:2 [Rhizophagus irregularis]|nr:7346_t:CDS:2 [Rhizophagus irregularis]